jgi:RND family efflux transporter MFP subunit
MLTFRTGVTCQLAAVAFTLFLSGCNDATVEAPPPRTVRVMEANPAEMLLSAQASGQIEARYTSAVGFLVSGRLISRNVDIGAMVKVGDMLARIDPTDFQNKVEASQAQVSAAQADVDQAIPQELRYRKLLSDGFTTQADYDRSLRVVQNAQANLKAAQANLRLAEDQLKYTQLLAPTDGVVTQTGADTGQVLQAGQMVVQIARLDEREAVFSVSPQRIAFAHPGMPVQVWPQDEPDEKVTGSIREIAPNADPVTGTYTVKVSLPDAPESLRLGTIVTGRVEAEGGVMTRIPTTALLQTGEQPQVWVVAQPDNVVKKTPVTVVRYDADAVTVSEGLGKGDLVVVAGVNSLAEGQQVDLQKVAGP